jgi:cell division protein FtsB
MKTASKKFKAKYEKEVAALEQKNIELKKKISEYKYDGKDKWEEFKRGFNQDLDIVGKAISDLFAKKK